MKQCTLKKLQVKLLILYIEKQQTNDQNLQYITKTMTGKNE